MNKHLTTKKNILQLLNRRFISLCLIMVALLFGSQFVTLAILGTRGTEVSRIRIQQQELRLENERLRAEIDKAKTLENIESGIAAFELQATRVQPVEVGNRTLTNAGSVGLAQ